MQAAEPGCISCTAGWKGQFAGAGREPDSLASCGPQASRRALPLTPRQEALQRLGSGWGTQGSQGFRSMNLCPEGSDHVHGKRENPRVVNENWGGWSLYLLLLPSFQSSILTRAARRNEKGSIMSRGHRRSSHQLRPGEEGGRKRSGLRAHAQGESGDAMGRDLRMRKAVPIKPAGKCSFYSFFCLQAYSWGSVPAP